MIRHGMVLAAGLGMRMRPLTERTAKPLLPLGGRTLLDHALDRLDAAGVEQVVVNTHWLHELVEGHLSRRTRPHVVVRRELALLDTGGAVVAALQAGALPPDAPFYVVNGDSFWLDGPGPMLGRLQAALTPEVDGVLLVHRTFQVSGDAGLGDFAVDAWGMLRRRREREVVPYLFAGVQLARPALFADAPAGAFSANWAWDRALAAGRLRCVVHDGLWFHLSRPHDLSEAEASLQMRETGETR